MNSDGNSAGPDAKQLRKLPLVPDVRGATVPTATKKAGVGLREHLAWKRRVAELLTTDPTLEARYKALRAFNTSIHPSVYHVTNACNIRCQGCWFFSHEMDQGYKDERSLEHLREFLKKERERKINFGTLLGGEPGLFPERIREYAKALPYLCVFTNGISPIPREGLENVALAVSVWGGGDLDDKLRGIKPSGQTFTGLFGMALKNYKNDPRAFFSYCLNAAGIAFLEDDVRRMRDNGNRVTFGYYEEQGGIGRVLPSASKERLLEEALRVKTLYPDTVINQPGYIEAIISGTSRGAKFGYDVCPTISYDHPLHKTRVRNGNATAPGFRAYASDLETVHTCCTGGECDVCHDGQAIQTWLLVSEARFGDSLASMREWIEIGESYWNQFIWSPFFSLPRTSEA
jgi:hypothetical protein